MEDNQPKLGLRYLNSVAQDEEDFALYRKAVERLHDDDGTRLTGEESVRRWLYAGGRRIQAGVRVTTGMGGSSPCASMSDTHPVRPADLHRAGQHAPSPRHRGTQQHARPTPFARRIAGRHETGCSCFGRHRDGDIGCRIFALSQSACRGSSYRFATDT